MNKYIQIMYFKNLHLKKLYVINKNIKILDCNNGIFLLAKANFS